MGELERARDVVQETFLRLCKQRREDVEEHLTEWLFTVCRNLALDVRRKERPMTTLSDEEVQRTASGGPPPSEELERRDTVSHVLHTLGSLPEKQAEVLRLKFQHGLSYKEISRITEDSMGNVGWLIHVGLKSLRAKLGSHEAPEARGAQA